MWTAQLTYHAPRLDLERRLEIVEALDANAAYNEDTGRLVLTFEVEGTTARQAADNAARTAGAVMTTAARGIVPARPTGISVKSTEEYIAEAAHPAPVELCGVAEIAAMANVTRQRAFQLIGTKDFPAPLDHLKSGPVFTKRSVDEFLERWEPRRAPGRPARTPDAGAPVDHDSPPLRRTTKTKATAARTENARGGSAERKCQMNGSNSITALVGTIVAIIGVVFVGKIILRRVGRPVTKVYNVVTPPAVYNYVPPQEYMPPPVSYNAGGFSANQHWAFSLSNETPVPSTPMTEEELFDDIVRNYDKP